MRQRATAISFCESKWLYWWIKRMCMIVDANLCSVVFKKTTDTSYQKLRTTIFGNRLMLIHGGQLTKEYERAGVLNIIAMLGQSGRAIKIADDLIDAQLALATQLCKSNDTHVIALARADRKRAHVLCTDDQALQADFKNKALIDNPRGTVYSPSRHKHSLANC
jgi:hypothetical protein